MKPKLFFEIDDDCLENIIQQNQIELLIDIIEKLVQNESIELFINSDLDLFLDMIDSESEEKMLVYSTLINASDTWQTKSVMSYDEATQDQLNFYEWQLGSIQQLTNSVLIEIAEREVLYQQPCFLMMCCISENREIQEKLYVIRDDLSSNPKSSLAIEIDYADCLSLNAFDNWLKQFKQKRVFRHNPKHDKSKRRNNKGEDVSVLLCSEERAIELLLNSYGEQDFDNNSNTKKRYSYDSEEGFFVEFMHERYDPNLEVDYYHGYHLEDEEKFEKDLSRFSRRLKDKLEEMKT